MSLIGILFVIAFAILLCKAILETIWGTCLIIYGLFCNLVAACLTLIANLIRFAKKIGAQRQRAAFRRPA